GISCSSTTDCQAVGVTGGPAAFAEHWNGSAWALESTPVVAGHPTALNSVSCTSAVRCTAVGETDDAPLAEAWNGRVWTLQTAPTPSDVAPFGLPPSVVLADVACASGSSCVAVGSYRDRAQLILTLAERWNGTRWTIDRTLNPQPPLVLGPVRDAEGNGGGSFCWVCFGKSLVRIFVGAPVDSADGNMYDTSNDISIPGRGTPLAFSR